MAEAVPVKPVSITSYDADFYAWTQEQVKLLREGRWAEVDLSNLIEEIESLGKQERRELENRLTILLGHLLKWQFQSDIRSKSWRATLREQRRQIRKHLKENPSLQPFIPEIIKDAYENSLDLAVRETLLDYKDFPSECPYRFEQAIDDKFLPD